MTVPSGPNFRATIQNGGGIGLLMKKASIPEDKESLSSQDLIYRTLEPAVWVDINLIYLHNSTRATSTFVSFLKKNLDFYKM